MAPRKAEGWFNVRFEYMTPRQIRNAYLSFKDAPTSKEFRYCDDPRKEQIDPRNNPYGETYF